MDYTIEISYNISQLRILVGIGIKTDSQTPGPRRAPPPARFGVPGGRERRDARHQVRASRLCVSIPIRLSVSVRRQARTALRLRALRASPPSPSMPRPSDTHCDGSGATTSPVDSRCAWYVQSAGRRRPCLARRVDEVHVRQLLVAVLPARPKNSWSLPPPAPRALSGLNEVADVVLDVQVARRMSPPLKENTSPAVARPEVQVGVAVR